MRGALADSRPDGGEHTIWPRADLVCRDSDEADARGLQQSLPLGITGSRLRAIMTAAVNLDG